MHGNRIRRPRRRSVLAGMVVAVLVAAAAAAVGGYLLLRTRGTPQQTAASYLRGWQRGSYAAMDQVSVDVPRSGLAGPLRQADAELGIRRIRLVPGPVTIDGGSARARFTATADLVSGHTWTYQGLLELVRRDRRWWVKWSPAAIYPGLRAGEQFVLSAAWLGRAPVLAADGTMLSSPRVIAESGSISLLTGDVVAATAAQARALGAPYQAGDLIGQGGIEQADQGQLAGRPSLSIRIEGPGHRLDATVARFPASPGRPVRTSIEMRVQRAASQAVGAAATRKPVDLVAIQPSTGRVLAVVERPGGFDRAIEGEFPPGSTFKVVTASALAKAGMRTTSPVGCPSQVTIGGRTFHNDNNEHLGTTSLQTAFAVSCNSTFAMLASQRLGGAALASMAATLGFNAQPALGIPATLGQFTTPHQPVDLAADAFGQGTDLVNPLSQAAVAAAIDDGTWRPPQLVTSPAPSQAARPRPLGPTILNTLRPMMRVLVEGGGTGADSAGPIANAFLRKL